MTLRSSAELLAKIRISAPGGIPLAEYRTLARELADPVPGLTPVRVVLLSTFTSDLLDPYLIVEGARHALSVDVFHGGWGQLEQALLGGEWRASDGRTEALALHARLEDLDPDVGFRFHASGSAGFDAFAEEALARLDACVELFRRHSSGPVLVANFATPTPRPLGIFDANDADSLTHRVHALNRELARRMSAKAGVAVWDYADLVASRGATEWTDPRLWALARAPVSAVNQPALATHLMRSLRALVRPAAKCLVLDLDDTLWGGVVGDEGVSGIRLGDEYPGSAFKRFQRAVLGLRDRGILLAVCSANDADVALEALSSHPEMILRPEHFSALRINWRPKSENLREIAEELNIGVDSLVLFDDNPAVRAEVRDRLPQVVVVEVPPDPVLYVTTLASVAELDVAAVTLEDRGRAASMAAESERRTAMDRSGSLGDFLGRLEMSVDIGTLDALSSQRVSQLVAKTNQYNLTTRRRSQAELEALAAREDAHVAWLRLRDRYGDMGLVLVAIMVREGDDALVDSLILSCRAANRGLEQTMLAHLAEVARAWGCRGLVGEYIPTERNRVVETLYPSLGFTPLGRTPLPGGGESARYRLDLDTQDLERPAYVSVRGGADA